MFEGSNRRPFHSLLFKEHSGDEVPILFHGEGVREDNVLHFGERDCMQGGLEKIEGKDIMPEILNLIGKQEVIE